jgi:hypothetical protein
MSETPSPIVALENRMSLGSQRVTMPDPTNPPASPTPTVVTINP